MDNQIFVSIAIGFGLFLLGCWAGFTLTKAYYVSAIKKVLEAAYKAGYATALSKRSSGRSGEKETLEGVLEEIRELNNFRANEL